MLSKGDRCVIFTKMVSYLVACHVMCKFKYYSVFLFASVGNLLVSFASLGKLEFSLFAPQDNSLVLSASFGKLEFSLFTSLGNSLVYLPHWSNYYSVCSPC